MPLPPSLIRLPLFIPMMSAVKLTPVGEAIIDMAVLPGRQPILRN